MLSLVADSIDVLLHAENAINLNAVESQEHRFGDIGVNEEECDDESADEFAPELGERLLLNTTDHSPEEQTRDEKDAWQACEHYHLLEEDGHGALLTIISHKETVKRKDLVTS
jgi:hypothetical protein